ncbi:MAG: pantoate--beta-alanine ligase [Putridiphycobacter sp.]
MEIVSNVQEIKALIKAFRTKNPTAKIGFVPTMGALHEGHLSLIQTAKKQADFVVVSIFVNPTQFNDDSDLEKYPRTLEADISLLQKNLCDAVFAPSESEIYPFKNRAYEIDLGGLDKVLEGKYRPGHFEGVCMVVERLFEIVEPDIAFFGIKDFQQVAIIKHMVKKRGIDVEIVPCPIKRDDFGLALSSRNMLLTPEQKIEALILFKTLSKGKELFFKGESAEKIRVEMLKIFKSSSLRLEYVEIVDNVSLKSVDKIHENCSICIAAYCGEIRLIDNIQLALSN